MSEILLMPFFKGSNHELKDLVEWTDETCKEIDKFLKNNPYFAEVEKKEKIGAHLKKALEYIEVSADKLEGLLERDVKRGVLPPIENAEFTKPKYKNALKTFIQKEANIKISGSSSFEAMKSCFPEDYHKELKNMKTVNYICGLIDNKIWKKIKKGSVSNYLFEKFTSNLPGNILQSIQLKPLDLKSAKK